MFFIQQANDHDCGFTCLKILLANIHHDSNYLFLTSPIDENENVSFLSLMKVAENYGITLEALKAKNKEEIVHFKKWPFIARINKDNLLHAIYVYKISKKYIYYLDPQEEKKKISIQEFIDLWTGEVLVIKSAIKTKCSIKKPKLVKDIETLITLALSLFSASGAFLAVYFINKDSYIYLPIIFFSLMLISEMILKAYSVHILKQIDKRMDDMINDIKNKDYMEFHITYETYKKYLLINPISIFSNILIFVIISLIFIINDKINVIYLIMNLVLAGSYSYFMRPKLNEEEKEILRNESLIKKAKNKLDAFSHMDIVRNQAYKYANKEYAFKCVVITIEIILTFIMMIYSQVVNVTYIICYSALQIYLYNNLVSLFTRGEDLSKQNNLLNKIMNNIENK